MLPYAEGVKPDEDDRSHSSSYYEKKERKTKWTDRILLNRPSKVVFVMLILVVLLPILLYSYVFSSTLDLPPSDNLSTGSCMIPREARLLCGLGNVTMSECHTQCCYDLSNNICYHRVPSRFSYISDEEWSEDTDLTARTSTEPFSGERTVETLRLSIDEVSATHLTITFYDPATNQSINANRLKEKEYFYDVSLPELFVEVFSDSGLIFSTIHGPLIAANDIWEIAFKLTNETMYGFGRIPLLPGTAEVIYSNNEKPDIIPLIFAKSNGSFHGLLIDNISPTEVFVSNDNQIVLRSITNNIFKLHIFTGPEPKNIMEDVMALINFEKEMNYWTLGTHVCTETKDSPKEAFADLREFMEEAQSENLHFDSHCGVSSVLFETVCHENRQYLEDGADLIRNSGKKFVPHLSPYISYEGAIDEESSEDTTNSLISSNYSSCYNNSIYDFDELLLRDSDGLWYTGLAEGIEVIYPDYKADNSWELIRNFWFLGNFDGIILENNWPLDETWKMFNETSLPLPYFNQHFEDAFTNTLPWNVTDSERGDFHMYNHNEYGNNFVEALKIFTNHSTPIWSTSHWMTSQIIINRQNVDVSWANLHRELINIALSGVSGNWFLSSPICGDTENFNTDTQTSICIKWYMAATYFPQIKIHSRTVPRHPLAFSGTNRNHMIQALNRRISLLPYFYTVLQSGPLLRPMFFQYPKSEYLSNINTQFNVGDDLLIVPNLLPGQTSVNVWVPPGGWYEIWSGLKLQYDEEEPFTMATAEADFLTLIRGGAILILQEGTKETAEQTRLESLYSIIIALECESASGSPATSNSNCHAEGKLYLSNNMTVVYAADSENLIITSDGDDYGIFCDVNEAVSSNTIGDIKIYGLGVDHNNYDLYRHVTSASINLCNLRFSNEVVYRFIEIST